MNTILAILTFAFVFPVFLIPYLTPLVSFVATAIVKKIFPKIPGLALPVVASAIGVGQDAIQSAINHSAGNPQLAAMLGLAATGVHQLYVQATKPKDPSS